MIPTLLSENKTIRPLDEKVYGYVFAFSSMSNGKCTASNETLAEMVKTTPKTIGNSLSVLEKAGFIKRIFFDLKRNNRKEIVPLVIFDVKKEEIAPSVGGAIEIAPSVGGGGPSVGGAIAPSVGGHKENNTNKIIKENNMQITIRKIFNYYQSQIYSGCRWIDSTREKIGTRLGVYSEEELLKAIDLFSKDSWWMENNSSRGPTWFFNSDHRIEQFLGIKPRGGEVVKGVYKSKEGLKIPDSIIV